MRSRDLQRLLTALAMVAVGTIAWPGHGPVAAQTRSHRLSVTVIDAQGEAIRGVELTLHDMSADRIQVRTTSRAGGIKAVPFPDGAKVSVVPERRGYRFEPPVVDVLMDHDVGVQFVGRVVLVSAVPEPDDADTGSVITGLVQWAFTNPDGTVNNIALEGARLSLDRTDVQQMQSRRPIRVTDENGAFEPFEVAQGAEYDVEISRLGFEFDPPRQHVVVVDSEVFVTFTGTSIGVGLVEDEGDDTVEAVTPAPTVIAIPPDPQVADLELPPSTIAVQVTSRIVRADGSIGEVGVDDALVRYRNVGTGVRGTRMAEGGIAPPYHTTRGAVFEITAEKEGYSFPTERVSVRLEETFVPIVGDRLPDTRCSIGGRVTDESGRNLRRFLGISVYDREGNYVPGRDDPLDLGGTYYIEPMPAGVYIVRITPSGSADPLYVSEPREIRVDCQGSMVGIDFTIR